MKTWTIEEMLAEGLCDNYPRARLIALWAGRKRLTLDEVLALDISDSDRVWAITRGLEGEQLLAWLERIVARTVPKHALARGVPTLRLNMAEWVASRAVSADEAWDAAGLAAELETGGGWDADAEEGWQAERAQQIADYRAVTKENDS